MAINPSAPAGPDRKIEAQWTFRQGLLQEVKWGPEVAQLMKSASPSEIELTVVPETKLGETEEAA